jgi:hypothetical protein
MSNFESIRQGLSEAINFTVVHDQPVEQDMKSEEFDKKFDDDLTRLLDLSKARRVGMKEKLLSLRGKVDIAPDWQRLWQMDIEEEKPILDGDSE